MVTHFSIAITVTQLKILLTAITCRESAVDGIRGSTYCQAQKNEMHERAGEERVGRLAASCYQLHPCRTHSLLGNLYEFSRTTEQSLDRIVGKAKKNMARP